MKVETNNIGILFRLGFAVFLGYFTWFAIKRCFIDEHHSIKETQGVYIFLCFVLYLLICFLISFRGIFKIVVLEEKSEIILSFLFRKEILKINEIEGYYVNSFWTRVSTIEGIILKTKSGKFVHLNEYELESLFYFNQFLISKNIPCLGKTFSWHYPFRVTPK